MVHAARFALEAATACASAASARDVVEASKTSGAPPELSLQAGDHMLRVSG
jgi:hypothetical protein